MYHARQTMLNVEESDRLSFLPDLFGNDFLAGEMQVYALAEKHITDYCGGFWHFIRIP
ncbi:antirestriction protein, partial [Klebsiella pneumoniae]|nr:antirestriction protein [Klebsiella pneumoniae]